MSKLSSVRGSKKDAAIFSNNVDAPTASIFARIQGKQTPPAQFAPKKQKFKPTRWRLKKGEDKELVIVDAEFTFGMREHTRQNRQGFYEQIRCISDFDSCPVCAQPNNRPYDVVILTVLDLTPWEKDGKTYEYTKRYLALKKNDYATFQAIASTQNGLRGVVLKMTRGHGDKESANGVPSFVNKLTEEDLIEVFGTPEKVYPSGFVLPANNAIVSFNYTEIFPVPTREELAAELGLAPRPGSKEDVNTNEPPPWEENELETIDLNSEYPEVD